MSRLRTRRQAVRSLSPITLTSLTVTTNPDTIVYFSREAISYSGIVVTASYSDYLDDDVTEDCLTPEEYANALATGVLYGDYVEPYDTITVREFGGFTRVNGQFEYIVRTFHDLYPASVVVWIGSPQATIDRVGENFLEDTLSVRFLSRL